MDQSAGMVKRTVQPVPAEVWVTGAVMAIVSLTRRWATGAVMAMDCRRVLPPKMYPARIRNPWLEARSWLPDTVTSATTVGT